MSLLELVMKVNRRYLIKDFTIMEKAPPNYKGLLLVESLYYSKLFPSPLVDLLITDLFVIV